MRLLFRWLFNFIILTLFCSGVVPSGNAGISWGWQEESYTSSNFVNYDQKFEKNYSPTAYFSIFLPTSKRVSFSLNESFQNELKSALANDLGFTVSMNPSDLLNLGLDLNHTIDWVLDEERAGGDYSANKYSAALTWEGIKEEQFEGSVLFQSLLTKYKTTGRSNSFYEDYLELGGEFSLSFYNTEYRLFTIYSSLFPGFASTNKVDFFKDSLPASSSLKYKQSFILGGFYTLELFSRVNYSWRYDSSRTHDYGLDFLLEKKLGFDHFFSIKTKAKRFSTPVIFEGSITNNGFNFLVNPNLILVPSKKTELTFDIQTELEIFDLKTNNNEEYISFEGSLSLDLDPTQTISLSFSPYSKWTTYYNFTVPKYLTNRFEVVEEDFGDGEPFYWTNEVFASPLPGDEFTWGITSDLSLNFEKKHYIDLSFRYYSTTAKWAWANDNSGWTPKASQKIATDQFYNSVGYDVSVKLQLQVGKSTTLFAEGVSSKINSENADSSSKTLSALCGLQLNF